MDKLDFLSPKVKQILGLCASVVIVGAFMAPQIPGASNALAQWSGWVSQLIGLLSLMLGLQVFKPKG